jgi:hypothetical protein
MLQGSEPLELFLPLRRRAGGGAAPLSRSGGPSAAVALSVSGSQAQWPGAWGHPFPYHSRVSREAPAQKSAPQKGIDRGANNCYLVS